MKRSTFTSAKVLLSTNKYKYKSIIVKYDTIAGYAMVLFIIVNEGQDIVTETYPIPSNHVNAPQSVSDVT
jgi:hypothetical protein